MTTKNKTSKDDFNAKLHNTDVISRLSFHVHNDIEDAAKWYKIPLAFWNNETVYVMQEDRCVFVGNSAGALQFITYNKGKYCQSRFPLNGL